MNEKNGLPDWVIYPENEWQRIEPEAAGIDGPGLRHFLEGLDVHAAEFGGEDHSNGKWGAVLTRGGYMLHSWGDPDYRAQTASTGKAFAHALLGLAVADGLVDPDEPIHRSWTGVGELSHVHKHLDRGHHSALTWRQLAGPKDGNVHYGGFAIELGARWREGRTGLEAHLAEPGIPSWAHWTGDPVYDLYSHAEPGTVGLYSSAGFWRLAQALTAVWNRDLKDVLDERLFSKIGILANSWEWPAGRAIKNDRYLYPRIPDAYTYLDPPYEVGGHPVRSGPGWAIISASDLARWGHLVATGGMWKGERLIDDEWLRGHGGGNKCGASGENSHYTAMGVVTTIGIDHPHSTAKESFLPEELFVGPILG